MVLTPRIMYSKMKTVLSTYEAPSSLAVVIKSILLSKIWSQIIKQQQPGTSNWMDSLLWKFKVSSSIETREELSTILIVNYYKITNTRRSYFPYEIAPLNRQEEFVMSVIYLRIMLLTGKHPQFKDIKKKFFCRISSYMFRWNKRIFNGVYKV